MHRVSMKGVSLLFLISQLLGFSAGVYVTPGESRAHTTPSVKNQMFCISGQLFPVHHFINIDADFGFVVLVFPCLHVIMGYVGVY